MTAPAAISRAAAATTGSGRLLQRARALPSARPASSTIAVTRSLPSSTCRLVLVALGACVCLLVARLQVAHALVFRVPFIDCMSDSSCPLSAGLPLLYNFSRVIPATEPPLSAVLSAEATFHAAAAFGPYPLYEQGHVIVLDSDIVTGIRNEFLCDPLPERLPLNRSILPRLTYMASMRAAFAASGLLDADAWRWPLLDATVSPRGAVLVASRGGCPFEQKAFFAQQAGAAALIVSTAWNGASPSYTEARRMITMQPDEDFGKFLRSQNVTASNWTHTIPSVFVSRTTFDSAILQLVLQNVGFQASYFHAQQRFLYPGGNPNITSPSSSSTGVEGTGGDSSSSTDNARRRLLEDSSSSSSTGDSSSSGDGSSGDASSSTVDDSSSSSSGSNSSSSSSSSSGAGVPDGPSRRPTDPLPFVPLSCIVDIEHTIDPDDGGSTGSDDLDYGGIRLAAYFLLILPAVWVAGACVYMIRGCCQRRRARMIRDKRQQFLDSFIVTFRAAPAPAAAAGAKRNPTSDSNGSALSASRVASPSVAEGKDDVEARGEEAHEYAHGEAIEVTSLSPSGYAPVRGTGNQPLHLAGAAALVLDMHDDDDDDASAGNNCAPPAAGGGGGEPSGGVGVNSHGKAVHIVGSACSVCLADYVDGEQLKVLPCKHAFHVGCIDPWLERSEMCPTCRSSVNDALELEPACWAWCCEPAQSLAQRGEAIARARHQQEQEERAREAAERARGEVQRVQEQQHRSEGVEMGAVGSSRHSVAAAVPGNPVLVVHADSAAAGSSDPFHAESVLTSVNETIAVVEAQFPGAGSSLAPLVHLRNAATQLAQLSRSGVLDAPVALSTLRQLLDQLPAVHAHFSGSRLRDDVTEAVVTLDSVVHFAIDQIQRRRA